MLRTKKNIMSLDFRTKIFISIILSYTLVLGNIQQKFPIVAAGFSLLPYIFLLTNKQYKSTIKGLLIIVLAYVIQKNSLFENSGFIGTVCLFIVMISLRLLPGFMMAKYALVTSTMSEITCALKKMMFPDVLIIPFTVMARFFHTAKEDYQQVKVAMYLRGFTSKYFLTHPLKFIEYRAIPLFMILTKTADDVAISAMTRGLRINETRTSLFECRLRLLDYFCIILMIILFGFYLGGKYA